MAAPDPIMTAGKPKNDRKAKPTLVEKDTSTWTWQNLSTRVPDDDICNIVQLAGLQRFAGDLIYGKTSCPLPLVL